MKFMDVVELIIEDTKYTKDGVHKGMHGWICDPDNINGYYLVCFPRYGEKDDIATIPIKEKDLKVIPILYALRNEEIEAEFE
ncbi:MAG: hypothetical protein Q4C42_01540 [Clostridia bacterium]|nr:hypothetical protein [Clostridia bacterium]